MYQVGGFKGFTLPYKYILVYPMCYQT